MLSTRRSLPTVHDVLAVLPGSHIVLTGATGSKMRSQRRNSVCRCGEELGRLLARTDAEGRAPDAAKRASRPANVAAPT